MALGGEGSGKASSGAIKAGEAFVEVSADDNKFQSTMKHVANKLHGFGGIVRNIGLGVAAAGATITAPLAGLFFKAVEYGKGVAIAARKAQTSAESISSLADVGSLDDLVAINGKLTKSAVAAADGTGEQAKAFEQMGISANDFLSMDIDGRFLKIAETAEKLESPLEKNTFLIALLGRSATEFGSKFTMGVEKLKEKIEEAKLSGAVISNKDAADSLQTMKALELIGKSIKFTWLEVGFALLGFSGNIKDASTVVAKFLQHVREFIKENRTVIATVFAIAAGVVIAGTGLAFFGLAMQGLITLIVTLTTVGSAIIGVVFSPLSIAIIAVTGTVVGLVFILHDLMGLLQAFNGVGGDFSAAWDGMLSSFLTAWNGISAALKKGEFQLAGKIAMAGLAVAFQEGIVLLTSLWIRFKASFVDGWHSIGYSVSLIWNNFTSILEKTFINVTAAIAYSMLWLVRQIAEGASKAAGLLDKIDPTGTAGAAKAFIDNQIGAIQEGMDTIVSGRDQLLNDIDADRNKKEREILDRTRDEQAARDKFRQGQITGELEELARLKKILDGLVAQAIGVPKPAGPELAPMPRSKQEKALAGLAEASKGLFTSRDYRGALGIGPASDEAKAQTAIQKDMLKELKEIRKKTGAPVFD